MRFFGFGGGTGAIFINFPSLGIEFLQLSGLLNASALALAQSVLDGDNFNPSLGKVDDVCTLLGGWASCSAIGSQLVGLIGKKRADFGVDASPTVFRDRAEPLTPVRNPKLS